MHEIPAIFPHLLRQTLREYLTLFPPSLPHQHVFLWYLFTLAGLCTISTNFEFTRELQGRYRMAVNGLRIIYRVHDDDRVVTIVAVRLRGAETYLNL